MADATYTLINTNPMGAVDLYIIGQAPIHLEENDEFDVSEEIAIDLLNQGDNYKLKDGQTDPRPAPAEAEEPVVETPAPAPAPAPTPAPDPAPSTDPAPAPADETAAPAPDASATPSA